MKAEPHSSASVEPDTHGRPGTLPSELRRIAASFHVRSSVSFSLFGRRYDARQSDTEENHGRLTSAARDLLADVLYVTMHCRQASAVAAPIVVPRTGEAGNASFATRLSSANTGTGSWQDGWTVQVHDDEGRLVIERGGLRLWAHHGDFVPDADRIAVGVTGRVRFPKEYVNLYPGHYVALGNAHRGQRDDAIRVYWNVTADGGPPLLARLSHLFNAAAIDFHLKILNSPQRFDRTDAAILYLPKKDWPLGRKLVAEVLEHVRGWLKPGVSAYVLPLAPGLGLAEDPVEHVSFGQDRSRLLAASLSIASEHDDAFDALVHGVHAAGLDPERFHLNAGSRHEYSL